ncbi:MAG: secondary thiamine-phosphate synthase enzyme YjbQ [Chlorobi bacterium]|nr:secondary thiamine-phosphate synthase enzyme YjbQ [Chlorobiota bacterium]
MAYHVYQSTLALSTSGHGDMHDITSSVSRIVAQSSIQTGIVNIHVIGSTGSVGTIEFEPGLQRDLPELLDRLMPPSRDYGHEQRWSDGNGHSHLQATMLGPSLSIPINNGSPVLGTWQQIFFLECDVRPRERKIVVTLQGEDELT